MTRVCLVVVLAIAAVASGAFKCPKDNGEFEDPVQCDMYYKCIDGVATQMLCPDGLVFDPFNRKINKCDHIFNVECGDRLELQPPQPSKNCPRRNGFFAHPDPSVCDVFYNCIDGESIKIPCTTGLHFDEYTGTCVWPDSAGRQGCGKVGNKLADGFECPKEVQHDNRDMPVDHPKYAHPEDCQKFYICLSGVTPREQGCSEGTVYNDVLQKCDDPKNVPGCEDWYKDDAAKP
ncbi:protein obstructor-E-like [Neodiprion virginianus]|uniref:protein obstructor-E-like n=1 Tax=Neodiprion virginianus TaxID=2961670 RepID=UPI001EE74EBE|nr:protein obstructor-E-like [Neodiprion virginianus]